MLVKGAVIFCPTIGPLQDPVTWYGINYAGTQIAQWDFQNKGKSGWTGKSSFLLEVGLSRLCYLFFSAFFGKTSIFFVFS